MTLARPVAHDPAGYDEDFFLWSQEQAARIRALRPNSLDWENVAEEIESLGRRDRRQIGTRLARLVQHLLKWGYQPERRSRSWQVTILNQRTGIQKLIEESPSLAQYPEETFAKAYADGRELALLETGLDDNAVPLDPPFGPHQALASGWLPDDLTTPV